MSGSNHTVDLVLAPYVECVDLVSLPMYVYAKITASAMACIIHDPVSLAPFSCHSMSVTHTLTWIMPHALCMALTIYALEPLAPFFVSFGILATRTLTWITPPYGLYGVKYIN